MYIFHLNLSSQHFLKQLRGSVCQREINRIKYTSNLEFEAVRILRISVHANSKYDLPSVLGSPPQHDI